MLKKIMGILFFSTVILYGSQSGMHIVEISNARHINQKLFEQGNHTALLEILTSEECDEVLWHDFDMQEEYFSSQREQLQICAELTHLRQANVDDLASPVQSLSCGMQVWYPESSQQSFQDPYVKMLCTALVKIYGQNCELSRQLQDTRQRNCELQDIVNRFIPARANLASALSMRDQEFSRKLDDIKKDLDLLRDFMSFDSSYHIVDKKDVEDDL